MKTFDELAASWSPTERHTILVNDHTSQECCPWNERFVEVADEPAYQAREGLDGPSLVELADKLLTVGEDGFRKMFRKSPMRRAGRAGLLRNVCVALGNWGAKEAVAVLTRALEDPEPLVREHAAWALDVLASPRCAGAPSHDSGRA